MGLNSKIHLVVNEYGIPINFTVLNGSCDDCEKAIYLIKNIDSELIFAAHVYDTNKFSSYFNKQNIKSVIPPERNRIYTVIMKRKLYCLRHIIENTFLFLKRRRDMVARYAKIPDAFIAPVFVRRIFMLF